jgi:glutamate/tyrosine decarboxylase-like PLP-dependent enzyme
VVANAGATNTGTVDRLRSLADYCRREQLWLHIDAAYGWAAVLTPEGASDLDGIGEADSVTFDPHKWFGQTFEAGGLLVRDGSMLERTFAIRPDYMQDVAPAGAEVNFADRGIALTRRFRALKIWLSIQVLGLGWFRRLAEHCQRLAEFAQRALEAHGRFEILCPRRLSIVCFRYVPAGPALIDADLDALNLAMLEELRREGFAFLSSTRLHGRVAVRFCFVNSRTTASDVEGIIDRLGMIGAKLCEANHGRLG